MMARLVGAVVRAKAKPKPRPTKKAAKEAVAAEKRKIKAKAQEQAFAPELFAEADRFFEQQSDLQLLFDSYNYSSEEQILKISEIVRKTSNDQYIRALATAYAFWIKSGKNPAYRSYVEKVRLARRARKNPNTTDLRMIIESLISHGDVTKEERKEKRGLYSRDEQAVRYIASEALSPTAMVELFDSPGQGVVRWAQLYRQREKAKPDHNDEVEQFDVKGTFTFRWSSNLLSLEAGEANLNISKQNIGEIMSIVKRIKKAETKSELISILVGPDNTTSSIK